MNASDQPEAEAATYTAHDKTQHTNIRALNGIQTHNPSSQAASDLHYRDQPSMNIQGASYGFHLSLYLKCPCILLCYHAR
jgi:hypothetical protein